MKIDDGTGSGRQAGVNKNNEVQVFSVSETEAQAAGEKGLSYNINTGDMRTRLPRFSRRALGECSFGARSWTWNAARRKGSQEGS